MGCDIPKPHTVSGNGCGSGEVRGRCRVRVVRTGGCVGGVGRFEAFPIPQAALRAVPDTPRGRRDGVLPQLCGRGSGCPQPGCDRFIWAMSPTPASRPVKRPKPQAATSFSCAGRRAVGRRVNTCAAWCRRRSAGSSAYASTCSGKHAHPPPMRPSPHGPTPSPLPSTVSLSPMPPEQPKDHPHKPKRNPRSAIYVP